MRVARRFCLDRRLSVPASLIMVNATLLADQGRALGFFGLPSICKEDRMARSFLNPFIF
jgi:hypothetical protein